MDPPGPAAGQSGRGTAQSKGQRMAFASARTSPARREPARSTRERGVRVGRVGTNDTERRPPTAHAGHGKAPRGQTRAARQTSHRLVEPSFGRKKPRGAASPRAAARPQSHCTGAGAKRRRARSARPRRSTAPRTQRRHTDSFKSRAHRSKPAGPRANRSMTRQARRGVHGKPIEDRQARRGVHGKPAEPAKAQGKRPRPATRKANPPRRKMRQALR